VKTTGRLRAFASRPYDFSLVESPPDRVMREIDAALEFWRLPPPPGPILELGCGTGRLTKPLLQRGYVVNAVEPDSRTYLPSTVALCPRSRGPRVGRRSRGRRRS
jgi:SAM-dependent methyltransferase